MKNRILSVAALALALAVTPALAQDNPQSRQDTAADQSGSNTQQPPHHRHRHADNPPANYDHDSANMALTGNEPGTAAYQDSNAIKPHPAVDHGHVPGDPPVINHNDDQVPVADPTKTTVVIPPK